MAINQATLTQINRTRREINALTDQQVTDLITAWVQAWDRVAPELEVAIKDLLANGDVTYAQAARNARMIEALALLGGQLKALSEHARATVTAKIPDVVREGAQASLAVIGAQIPPVKGLLVDWERIDQAAITAIITRTTEQITSELWPLADDVQALLRRELVRGVIVGDNPNETARALLRRAEQTFNGGLARAANIARTEMLDAHREGNRAAAMANADVLTGWTWIATLDARTCIACWSQHGSEHQVSQPGPWGHQSCRCTRADITKSWADLGFHDIPEPASLLADAETTFKNLDDTTQRRIMGPTRLRMYKEGEVTWADMAKLRHTDGWRDSYVVRPVKELELLAKN